MKSDQNSNRLSLVYTPTQLTEALTLYEKNPDALIFAGGTAILAAQKTRVPVFNRQIISLQSVEELLTIKRSEGFVDIGAALPLAEILRRRESRFLPPLVRETIQSIGTPALRNQATIGGNICTKNHKLLLLPVLVILDSFLEVRSRKTTRFLEVRRFLNDQDIIELDQGEIITKIRIPSAQFNLHGFTTLPGCVVRSHDYFMMAFAARKNRSILEKVHFAFNIDGKHLFRSKQATDRLIGKNFPLSPTEIQEELTFFETKVEEQLPFLPYYKKKRILNYYKVLLTKELSKLVEINY